MNLPGLKGTKLVELPYLELKLSDQTEESNILIVGERISNGGVIQTVMKRPFKNIVCTDIDPIASDSNLEKIISEDNRVSFVQGDYLMIDFKQKFDYVVCISVLEHFGMNFAEHNSFDRLDIHGDDAIRWDHDLRGLNKMMNDGQTVIVTVPIGPPISYGDINTTNNMPMLRRYDESRINLIERLSIENEFDIDSSYFFSQDFTTWYEAEKEISNSKNFHLQNPYTPNSIWAFTLEAS